MSFCGQTTIFDSFGVSFPGLPPVSESALTRVFPDFSAGFRVSTDFSGVTIFPRIGWTRSQARRFYALFTSRFGWSDDSAYAAILGAGCPLHIADTVWDHSACGGLDETRP